MPWTRASSLSRSLACPASTVLPTYDPKSEKAQDAADWGTLAHHWANTGVILDHRYAELLRKHIDTCGIDRLALWPDNDKRIPAGAFAIDCSHVDLCTVGYTNPDPAAIRVWKSQFDDDWFTGEWDYAADHGHYLKVNDLKTGWPVPPHDPQLVSYGLGLWLLQGRRHLSVELSVTHWPRPNLQAKNPRAFHPPTTEYYDIDADTLMAFGRTLHYTWLTRQRIAASDNPELAATPGEHCLFCPARIFCSKGSDQ